MHITKMKMRIFDTLSVAEKNIDTSSSVRIYMCGVTVYDESHIGHARTIIVFDTLRRYLESKGVKVNLIQNFNDFDKLNVKRADLYPKATEHISDMINMIKGLIEKGFAYTSKNGVYFSLSKFKEYGKDRKSTRL